MMLYIALLLLIPKHSQVCQSVKRADPLVGIEINKKESRAPTSYLGGQQPHCSHTVECINYLCFYIPLLGHVGKARTEVFPHTVSSFAHSQYITVG